VSIEIRQMVIKSNIDGQAGKSGKKAVEAAADKDASNDDCGGGCGSSGGPGGDDDRQRMRAMLAAEFERMRER
jgi:hypothetical protein